MEFIAIYDTLGNVSTIVSFPADAPPPAVVTKPGELVAKVKVPEGMLNLNSPGDAQRVVEALKGLRVEARDGEGELVGTQP